MSMVQLHKVNLHYWSQAFRETSLKSHVFKMLRLKYRKPLESVHALKDINLDIKPGDRIALIGHNGAGKSTLLKTIAGLYPISSGKRTVSGKIRALFELSLGFEAEATGRENILYRGLLLGQTPKQMRKLTDEIIQFTDINQFIDYPIKTYSAGMLVRLAFAISTAIPGDILLLDEVIAAGDADFAKKSRLRINQLINNAEVMVLASHDFNAAKELCTRSLVVDHGQILCDGTVEEGVAFYENLVRLRRNGAG